MADRLTFSARNAYIGGVILPRSPMPQGQGAMAIARMAAARAGLCSGAVVMAKVFAAFAVGLVPSAFVQPISLH